ncbi:hypothetical protein ACHAW5_001902 [Stephanodiscus triporus]|uniref:Uncharacterized protein n=1 Tax=Stephanodiscus triporus TaxID=2934178 RepID=A0ABD3PHS3_9STRA
MKATCLPLYKLPVPVPKLSLAPNTIVMSSSVKYCMFPTHLFDAGGHNSPIVMVYTSLVGSDRHDRDKILCHFTSRLFDLVVSDFNGASYRSTLQSQSTSSSQTRSSSISARSRAAPAPTPCTIRGCN